MNLNTNDQAQDLPADLPWDEEAIVSPTEYNLAVTTTTPSAKVAVDISSLTESLDVEVVKQEVAAELEAAKESIRVDAVNTAAAESPLLVQMLIDRIAEDGKEHPDLLHFLPYLEGQKEWLLGRADYEDGHARALCHFWQLMLADDGTPGTLALRAKIDIGEVGNYHNAAFVQWWEENIRPWAITHGAMFNPEVIAADAEKVLLAASEAVIDVDKKTKTASVSGGPLETPVSGEPFVLLPTESLFEATSHIKDNPYIDSTGVAKKTRGAATVTMYADDNSGDGVMKGTLVLDASGRPGTLTRLDFTPSSDGSTAPVVLKISSGSGYISADSIGETNIADECYDEVVPSPEMREVIDTAVGENSLSFGARLTTTTDADGNVRLVDVVGMSVVDAGNGTPAPDGTVHLNCNVENRLSFGSQVYIADANNVLGVDTASDADSTDITLLERDKSVFLVARNAVAQEALVKLGTAINEKYSDTGAYTFSATEGTVTAGDTRAAVEAGDGVVLLEREGCGVLASMAAMSAVTTAFKDIRESQAASGNAMNNNG